MTPEFSRYREQSLTYQVWLLLERRCLHRTEGRYAVYSAYLRHWFILLWSFNFHEVFCSLTIRVFAWILIDYVLDRHHQEDEIILIFIHVSSLSLDFFRLDLGMCLISRTCCCWSFRVIKFWLRCDSSWLFENLSQVILDIFTLDAGNHVTLRYWEHLPKSGNCIRLPVTSPFR